LTYTLSLHDALPILSIDEIGATFYEHFCNLDSPLAVTDYDLDHHIAERGQVLCRATIVHEGTEQVITGRGNGPINAFVHALEEAGLKHFNVTDYRSHAVRGGSDANAAAYVQVQSHDGVIVWGAGIDPSIEMAGLKALVSACNLLRRG
jgi:2-isopropylmalate synthase